MMRENQIESSFVKISKNPKIWRRAIGIFLIIFSSLIFLFLIFRNISYPLLWNDESETVMYGKRVLQFGYPKITDGNNILYAFDHPDPKLAWKSGSDAYIGTGWGHFYFALIGIKLAELTSDLYFKTALLRTPYALIGCLGLVLLLLSALKAIESKTGKIYFSLFFIVFLIFSISLILNLKEVRYYSLVILLYGWLINEYFNYFISYGKYWRYFISIILASLLLLFSFYPAFFIALAILFVHISLKFLIDTNFFKKNLSDFKTYFYSLLPVIISLILSIPYLIYFETFHISSAMSKVFSFDFATHIENIGRILKFFSIYQFLFLAIFVKLIYWVTYFFKADFEDQKLKKINFVSNFYLLTFVIYIIAATRVPFFFERYFIVLEPIIILMILADSFGCFYLFSRSKRTNYSLGAKMIFLSLFGLVLIIGSTQSFITFKSYLYEVAHRYMGPLDYLIPFLKEKYPDSSKIIIATNYEENSYRYYLNCKVIIGYYPSNNPNAIFEDEIKLTPDVIIFRKSWGQSPVIFEYFQKKADYEPYSFPVFDSNVNNIAELTTLKHQFKTLEENNPDEKVTVLIKKND